VWPPFSINTIKDELPTTIVSLRIIVYPAILCVNLPGRIDISGEVHVLQAQHYMSFELSFGM
jgi:hypothetical protein